MKLLTFVNLAYVDILHNLYLQLKRVGLEKDLIVYTIDDLTKEKIDSFNLECKTVVYKPSVFKDVYDPNLFSNKLLRSGYDILYSSLQFFKHDCVYQTLENNEYVCLIDPDMLVYSNFVDDLKSHMNCDHKFGYTSEVNFALKYYINVNIVVDTSSPILYEWIGRCAIINGGFMAFHHSQETFDGIKGYCSKFIPHFAKHCGNIDEHIVTNYFAYYHHHNICMIPDSINTINDCGYTYNPDQVNNLKCHTFHPTFIVDKVEYIRQCGQWFVE